MQVYLLLTEKCNLNCKMCIRGDKNDSELSLETVHKIKCLQEFSNHDVVITGGEPTVCKEFESIVLFFKKRAKSVTICTNGIVDYYINKQFFSPNVSIQISIDGEETAHDSIRGNGTFRQTFRTISKLESLCIPYTISTVVNRNNVKTMKNLADELSHLKCMKYWNVSYEMPFGHASIDDLMPAEDWNAFVDQMLEYVSFRMRIQKMFPFEIYKKYRSSIDDILKKNRCANCGSGKQKIYVYPDLSVFPCTCLTDFNLGSLRDYPLSFLLKTKQARLFSDYTIQPNAICRKCEYLKICNGGCIGMSYHFFHELGWGDIRCPIIRDSNEYVFCKSSVNCI